MTNELETPGTATVAVNAQSQSSPKAHASSPQPNRMNRVQLDQHLKSLVARERELLHEILMTIQEISARRLYAEAGYSSLFAYLTEGIGYSEGAAQRRIEAVRLLREVPTVAEQIKSGEIKLTQIALVQKSAREAQRRGVKPSPADKSDLLQSLVGQNRSQSEQRVAEFFDLPVTMPSSSRTQQDGSVRMEVSFTAEQFRKLEQAQELLSHSLASKDLVAFVEYLSEKVIRQKTQTSARKPAGQKPHPGKETPYEKNEQAPHADATVTATVAASSIPNGQQPSRLTPYPQAKPSTAVVAAKTLPAALRREVLTRDDTCQYQDPLTGKICGSRWQLQVDHQQSRWAGGDDDVRNLQSLCGTHNRLKYRHEAGIRPRA